MTVVIVMHDGADGHDGPAGMVMQLHTKTIKTICGVWNDENTQQHKWFVWIEKLWY